MVTRQRSSLSFKKKRKTMKRKRKRNPKSKFGISNGRKTLLRKTLALKDVIKGIKKRIQREKPKKVSDAIMVAQKTTSTIKNKIRPARVINIPKRGGFLPLIPIFAGLSALGALSGGAAGIAKAVQDAKAAKEQLQESQRHNQTMESIAIGKGLYLKPYKSGLGLFLKPAPISKHYP